MEELNQEVKDRLEKVCVCRGITKEAIKNSIRNGNKTLEAVSQDTGATQGGCKGFRCKAKIEELIVEFGTEWN
ncbi:MAG: (2Fe-2S)-binding protein [Niameybacter sp.]|uniref:(2Fe-2S)-binding protein n=1 Tax=Niameybacter sp. TaxID=2033640 RepID=UPI002FCA978D